MAKIIYKNELGEGTALTGTILKDDGVFIYLQRQDNKTILINKSDINKIELSGNEVMP